MAVKKIDFKFNLDTKDVEVAAGKTLSLAQELRILKKELLSTQEGTREFEILSSKVGAVEDSMARANAKSRDLLASFQLIPGPIGEISSQLNGSIGLMKVFSSYSFKDIMFQLKETVDDFKDVGANIGKATGITKVYTTLNNALSKSFVAVGVGEAAATTGAKAFAAALTATGIGAIVVALGYLITNFDKVRDAVYKLIPGMKAVGDAIGDVVNFFTDLIGVTSEAERAEAKRQATYAKSKAATEILNQGIQREINILKAKGATQEELDKKEKQMIKNQLKDLTAAANERGVLAGEQATLYKDLQNKLIVIDETAKKTKADADKKASEEAAAKRKSDNEKAIADGKAYQQKVKEQKQAELDAIVQLEKDSNTTREAELRSALERQYALRNEGKTISVAQAKLQADEINKIVKDELQKDKDDRQKAFDEKVAMASGENALIVEGLKTTIEETKLLYGEESAQARKATQDVFDARKEGIDNELALLEQKKLSFDGLTEEEKTRIQELGLERRKLTVEVQTENQRQIDSDRAKAQTLYDEKMAKAGEDYELQQTILDAKIAQDAAFFEAQLAQEGLTAEKRKAILDAQTKNVEANAVAQVEIEKKKFAAQQQLLGATANAITALADIVGKNTVAGKALAVAASLINTYAAIAGQLKAFAGVPVPGYAIVQAVATGLVGFKAVADIIKTPVPTDGGASTSDVAKVDAGVSVPKPRGLASGGVVVGPGTGTSDSIPTMLSNGESVINAASTSMFRPLLSTINMIGGGARFDGGIIGTTPSGSTGEELPLIKTYVVASDMTNQQQFDRIQKSRADI